MKPVALRPFELSDIEFFRLIRSCPDFLQYLAPPDSPSFVNELQAFQRVNMFAEMARQGPWGPRVIYLIGPDRPIGICGLIPTENLPAPELTAFLLKDFRGNGYCTEGVRILLDHFRDLNYGAFVERCNVRSLALISRLRMMQKGEIHHPALRRTGLWFEGLSSSTILSFESVPY